jgi:hypothetical protein
VVSQTVTNISETLVAFIFRILSVITKNTKVLIPIALKTSNLIFQFSSTLPSLHFLHTHHPVTILLLYFSYSHYPF